MIDSPTGHASPHALAEFAPEPPSRRSGIALALSGGGYRAALFHLGALRRLHELGVLPRVDEVTAVSGGSIAAAVLARASLGAPAGSISDFDAQVAAPLRAFTGRNIRTPALLRQLLPWRWGRGGASHGLTPAYRALVGRMRCAELPARPDVVFCSTDLTFGVNWTYSRARMGDFQAGYAPPRPDDEVAIAVAASSCFPPIFQPLRPRVPASMLARGAYRGADRVAQIRGLRLTDGGAYDNLGLEPVWKRSAMLLVSDGGGPFEFSADQGLFWRVRRYADLLYKQVGALRKRWLIAGYISGALRGAYWGIAGDVRHYDAGAPGYSGELAERTIARIRTDLDAFSDAERAVLENHGYALADVAVREHVADLLPTSPPSFAPPHPDWDWTHERAVERALARSHRRTLLGRW